MFTQNFPKILMLICLFSSISILGCTATGKTSNLVKTTKKSDVQKTNSDNSAKLETQQIQGKLIYEEIPPGKSVRAYKGEEFFLITTTKQQDKLVLRPSKEVSHSQLKSFHNQDVEITAIYKQGTRPDVSKVACPMDQDRQCMIQGKGYEVLSVAAD